MSKIKSIKLLLVIGHCTYYGTMQWFTFKWQPNNSFQMHNSQCPKHQPFVSGTVDRFQICAILKRHNSLFVSIIPVANGFPFPAFPALRNPWVFASSWFRGLIWNLSCFIVNSTNFKARSIFSFLNLSYIKEWSGKYSPFLELSRRLMSKRHILSYQVLLAQILKMKLLSQMNSVDQVKGVAVLAGHLENWTQWPIVVTQVPIERSYHTRTLTHCGHKANKPSRCTRWRECQTTTEFANYSDIE